MTTPTLYSLQNCPYAMRARLGILLAQQTVTLRAVKLNNKPEEMLKASPKGEVPVLVFDDGSVIDESLDIMIWAAQRSELTSSSAVMDLIKKNDHEFIANLEQYKRAKRYHDSSEKSYKAQCEGFADYLEERLNEQQFVIGNAPSIADYAILPFMRQFSRVDRQWFLGAPYPNLRTWLNKHLQSRLYAKAMFKYPLWLDSGEEFVFGVA